MLETCPIIASATPSIDPTTVDAVALAKESLLALSMSDLLSVTVGSVISPFLYLRCVAA
jgi:hypothetical protein